MEITLPSYVSIRKLINVLQKMHALLLIIELKDFIILKNTRPSSVLSILDLFISVSTVNIALLHTLSKISKQG
jgi:hypothetical protein